MILAALLLLGIEKFSNLQIPVFSNLQISTSSNLIVLRDFFKSKVWVQHLRHVDAIRRLVIF
jgi:hypothetical protein